MKKVLIILVATLLCPASAWSVAQDHQAIRDCATAFVQQQITAVPGTPRFEVSAIDSRITLEACAKLQAFLPQGSRLLGRSMVGVRCIENKGWSILLPVQIKTSLEVWVSSRQLAAGHVLQIEDLSAQTIETTRVDGITHPLKISGKVLRYGIGAGQILRDDMLRAPYSVTQGQTVQLLMLGQGFTVRSAGLALSNASDGEAVNVKSEAGKIVSGQAHGNGVVALSP